MRDRLYYSEAGDRIESTRPVLVSRYRGFTRANHWVTAISLIALLLPGALLFFSGWLSAWQLLLVQWAKKLGARVLATVGSPEKAALAKHYGADQVILYREEPVAAKVRQLTDGKGVDVVYDAVGQSTFMASLDSLKPRGMMVSYGQASGPIPPFDLSELAKRGSLYLTRPTLGDYAATRGELRTYTVRPGTVGEMVKAASTIAGPPCIPKIHGSTGITAPFMVMLTDI